MVKYLLITAGVALICDHYFSDDEELLGNLIAKPDGVEVNLFGENILLPISIIDHLINTAPNIYIYVDDGESSLVGYDTLVELARDDLLVAKGAHNVLAGHQEESQS